MTWTSLDTWIVITGILSALACAIPGCFLVLRKMSMMGDAISHAVLPGLALAFLFTHSRDSLSMFIGAAAVGVLTALFIDWVNRLGRVEESAAMGVVFTTLFALGAELLSASCSGGFGNASNRRQNFRMWTGSLCPVRIQHNIKLKLVVR